MKRVLIITQFDLVNYGQKLQNYAVQELVRECGCEPVTFVDREGVRRRRYSLEFCLRAWFGIFLGRAKPKRTNMKQRRRMKAFIRRNLACACMECSDVRRKADRYDAFVVGSDQVWNKWSRPEEKIEFYFLRFAPQRKRVCFAPSFGMEQIPEELRALYTKCLEGFDRLSCREQSGCEIIRELTGREAELLCDPTMMLPPERWRSFAKRPAWKLPERYLLAYFLGNDSQASMEKVRSFAERRGLPVIELKRPSKPNEFCIDPAEFVYLVFHAEYVCTDSFHGCVFSILGRRAFTVFPRNAEGADPMYGRIRTLLGTFDLRDREDCERMGEAPNFAGVEDVLEGLRAKGRNYLRAALGAAMSEGASPEK